MSLKIEGINYHTAYRQAHDFSVDSAGESILPPGNVGMFGSVGYDSAMPLFKEGKLLQNVYQQKNGILSEHILVPKWFY